MGVCCVCNKQSSNLPESPLQCVTCKLHVHKECYGIASQHSSTEQWMCQRCLEGVGTERCELCPFSDGALKKTDNGRWAHILCAQYIPEVIFGNNYSMEPINLAEVPKPRFQQICYICDEKGDAMAKRQGACMQCNVQNCINCFHVTCGQRSGLLVAEDCDNRRIVDYYGFCSQHVKQNSKNTTVKLTEPKYSYNAQKPSILSQSKVKAEKLPAVDTLVSQRLKDATKVITNVPPSLTLDPNTTSTIKPMQPKVRAYPLPFQGVHKQTSISISGELVQNSEGGLYSGGGGAKEETTTATTTTCSTSSNSTPTPKHRKRKSSSSTDTADNEDMRSEVPVKTLQNLANTSSDNKSQLIIVKQNAPNDEASEEGYNDLTEVFNKKVKKKKYKSPDSEFSDYTPYQRKRNSLHKKGKRPKGKKDPFKIRKKDMMKIKSPKYSHNSYLYKSPPKTPIKIQQSKLLTGDKGYSPTSIVSKMMRETRGEVSEFKPCSGKPLLSADTFFDRFKEMGMQYIISECTSSKSQTMLKELQSVNQVNSYLSNKLKAKAAKLEQLRKLNARLSVPYTNPMKQLPEPAPMSRAIAKLLSTLHNPPAHRDDVLVAETWLDEESVEEIIEKKKKTPVLTSPECVERREEEVCKIPVPPTMTALVEKNSDRDSNVESSKTLPVPTTDVPQIIIAGDPPMAYTYKDGALVGYNPDTLQSSAQYSKLIEDQYNKVVEQHYKEKISAAYFEAQRRHYEGLLQHQIQSKLQSSSDYLAQAYLSEPWNASYYYGQQSSGRQMPSLTPHFPATSLPQSYPGSSSTHPPTHPSTSRS